MHSLLNRTTQSSFLTALTDDIADLTGSLGLLLVQVNNIGELNLHHGYRVVDLALTHFAERLADGFSRDKVVRVGTARFAIVLRSLGSTAHALLAANKVRQISAMPLEPSETPVAITVAQGAAVAPEHGETAEDLLRCAESALLSAGSKRDAIVLYSPEQATERLRLARVDEELGRALEAGGIEVAFQPQVDIASGRTVGAEALLRCRTRSGEWLPPELVIRSAERSGRLTLVTSAVLNTALRYAADWPDRSMSVSINVSAPSLLDSDFVSTIASAAEIWNRPLERLTIELTETTIMDSPEESLATMRQLRTRGARVALDDFGVGYSSLSYFRDIPATELKVDKSFVSSMLKYAADRAIVDTVIKLAHAFGLSVVAEGVEDASVLELLRVLGCDVAQGYYYSRPLAPASFAKWLASHPQ